ALFGVSPAVTRHMVGVVIATSPEAERLLEAMPNVVRSVAVSTTMRPRRCLGEVRGPVLWSETNAARAASASAGDVFICASPVKAFDTEENQVLVHVLTAIRDAARDADGPGGHAHDDPAARRWRHNGARALRFLEHRTLVDVTRGRPSGRAVRRARAGSRRRT